MKKILVILLTALMFFSLSACKEKEVEVVGGWSEKEEEINDELLDVFNKATEGLTGVGYKPLKLIGTQVVAGTNYKFLCEATTVTANPETSKKVVTIYQDLEGKCEILDISDYNE